MPPGSCGCEEGLGYCSMHRGRTDQLYDRVSEMEYTRAMAQIVEEYDSNNGLLSSADPFVSSAWVPLPESAYDPLRPFSSSTSTLSTTWWGSHSHNEDYNEDCPTLLPSPSKRSLSPDNSSYCVYQHKKKREKERTDTEIAERALIDHSNYCTEPVQRTEHRVPELGLPPLPIQWAFTAGDSDSDGDSCVENRKQAPCPTPGNSVKSKRGKSKDTSSSRPTQRGKNTSSSRPTQRGKNTSSSRPTQQGKNTSSRRPTQPVKRLQTKPKPVSKSKKLDQSEMDKKEKNQIKARKERERRNHAREILGICRDTLRKEVPEHARSSSSSKSLSEQRVLDCETEVLHGAWSEKERVDRVVRRALRAIRKKGRKF